MKIGSLVDNFSADTTKLAKGLESARAAVRNVTINARKWALKTHWPPELCRGPLDDAIDAYFSETLRRQAIELDKRIVS